MPTHAAPNYFAWKFQTPSTACPRFPTTLHEASPVFDAIALGSRTARTTWRSAMMKLPAKPQPGQTRETHHLWKAEFKVGDTLLARANAAWQSGNLPTTNALLGAYRDFRFDRGSVFRSTKEAPKDAVEPYDLRAHIGAHARLKAEFAAFTTLLEPTAAAALPEALALQTVIADDTTQAGTIANHALQSFLQSASLTALEVLARIDSWGAATRKWFPTHDAIPLVNVALAHPETINGVHALLATDSRYTCIHQQTMQDIIERATLQGDTVALQFLSGMSLYRSTAYLFTHAQVAGLHQQAAAGNEHAMALIYSEGAAHDWFDHAAHLLYGEFARTEGNAPFGIDALNSFADFAAEAPSNVQNRFFPTSPEFYFGLRDWAQKQLYSGAYRRATGEYSGNAAAAIFVSGLTKRALGDEGIELLWDTIQAGRGLPGRT